MLIKGYLCTMMYQKIHPCNCLHWICKRTVEITNPNPSYKECVYAMFTVFIIVLYHYNYFLPSSSNAIFVLPIHPSFFILFWHSLLLLFLIIFLSIHMFIQSQISFLHRSTLSIAFESLAFSVSLRNLIFLPLLLIIEEC